jgi:hypothetical protein
MGREERMILSSHRYPYSVLISFLVSVFDEVRHDFLIILSLYIYAKGLTLSVIQHASFCDDNTATSSLLHHR